jgi:hypothetical protein
MESWLEPLSNAGIFLVAGVGALIGRPFVRELAAVGRPPEVTRSDLFRRITAVLTWNWVAAFAGMTISSEVASRLLPDRIRERGLARESPVGVPPNHDAKSLAPPTF